MASFGGTDTRGRNPADDAKIVADVEAAARAGDITRAIELARKGLQGGLIHPLLLNLRAYWLETQDHDEEALADLTRAVFLAPKDALIQNSYGLCLSKLNRRPQAIAAFRASVAAEPSFAHAHFNLGMALEREGELIAAQQSYERALALRPDFVEPLARLAGLAARIGNWSTAHKLGAQVLAIEPKNAIALTAMMRAALAADDLENAEKFLPPTDGEDPAFAYERAIAHSLLGDLRHAQARFPEAFDAYKAGNIELKNIYASRYDGPETETALSYVIWLAEQFIAKPDILPPAQRNDVTGADGGSAGHVFLVGFPRSGTTLLENILGSHPLVVSLEEKNTLGDATSDYFANLHGLNALANLKGDDLVRARARYWQHVQEFGADVQGKIFVDKHPLMSIKLPLVSKFFPKAKVLFAVRDPRDVVLSCYRRLFTINPSMYEFLDLERSARYYDAVMRLSLIYRLRLGLDWHEIRHEKLIEDFEGEARKACEFIGIAWDEKMRDFTQRSQTRPIATPSALQVMKGLNRDGVGQWRNYREQLAPVLPILQPWVKKFGYPED